MRHIRLWISMLMLAVQCLPAGGIAANGGGGGGTWSRAAAMAELQRLDRLLTAKDGKLFKLEFQAWKRAHGKSYKTAAEEARRLKQFRLNAQKVVAFNQQHPTGRWWAALNSLSDLSWGEFSVHYLGGSALSAQALSAQALPAAPSSKVLPARSMPQAAAAAPLPPAWDWHALGKTTPVKDQGPCGSCWAHAVVGALEAMEKIATGTSLDLSEQQLVDCDSWDFGCGGGWPLNALQYISSEGGLVQEAAYPYTAASGTCRLSPAMGLRYTTGSAPGYGEVPPGSRTALMKAVLVQPTVVMFNVEESFLLYGGGIYTPDSCGTDAVNHAMVAVGYNTTEASWKLRNSFGAAWGEAGHVRVAMQPGSGPGLCGMYLQGGWYPMDVTAAGQVGQPPPPAPQMQR